MVTISTLKQTDLFHNFSSEELYEIQNNLRMDDRHFNKNHEILNIGQTTNHMEILISGAIMIMQEDLWGYRNIMSYLTAGDTFAEIFAFSKQPCNIRAITVQPSVVLFIDIDDLMISSHPTNKKIIANLIHIFAMKTMKLNEKITHMSMRTTKAKLLSYLSSCARKTGNMSFDIPYNRQQLADYLCIDRASMTVELSKLQSNGYLSINKNHFDLHI